MPAQTEPSLEEVETLCREALDKRIAAGFKLTKGAYFGPARDEFPARCCLIGALSKTEAEHSYTASTMAASHTGLPRYKIAYLENGFCDFNEPVNVELLPYFSLGRKLAEEYKSHFFNGVTN